jgi:hypothetical protein
MRFAICFTVFVVVACGRPETPATVAQQDFEERSGCRSSVRTFEILAKHADGFASDEVTVVDGCDKRSYYRCNGVSTLKQGPDLRIYDAHRVMCDNVDAQVQRGELVP